MTEAQLHNRDRKVTTRRFPFTLFIVAELLCTGVLVLWLSL